MRHRLIINVALAAAYFFLGQLGQATAMPPAIVSMFFPAAGLAMAACLFWGSRRVWFGVLLGALLFHITVAGGIDSASAWLVGTSIATGSLLQAMLAAYILRRLDPAIEFTRTRTIVYLIPVVALSCLLASGLTNLTLWASGTISLAQLPRNLISWWLGNTLGILIAMPMILALIDARPLWRQRRVLIGIPLAIALGLCGAIYGFARDEENNRVKQSFAVEARALLARMGEASEQSVAAVRIVADGLAYPENRTPHGFTRAFSPVLDVFPLVQSLNWLPLVRSEARTEFERNLSQQWGRPFVIAPLKGRAFSASGWSAPVTFIEPLAPNAPALGRDLLSEPVRAAAIEKAWQQRQVTATGKITLVQDLQGPGGILINAPVIVAGEVTGVAITVMNLRKLLKPLQDAPGLYFRVRDTLSGDILMNTLAAPVALEARLHVNDSGVFLRDAIQLADRSLEVVLHRKPALGATISTSTLVLGLALSMSAMLVLFMLSISANLLRTEQTVIQRTEQLNVTLKEMKLAQAMLHASETRWQFALEGAGNGVWDWDVQNSAVWVSERFKGMLGLELEDEISGDLEEWSSRIHPDDRQDMKADLQLHLAGQTAVYINEHRVRCKDGSYKWILGRGLVITRDATGKPLRVVGTHADITERKHAQLHEQHIQTVLKMLTDRVALKSILERIVLDVEALNPGSLCSILLLDEEGKLLRPGAAPSLPDFYNQAIDGLAIGLAVGSCGTAAFTGKTVIVEDIQTHPYWAPYRDLASQAELASCWAQPIISGEGKVQGSFAVYHRTPSTPTSADLKLIEDYAVLASLAITKSADVEKLRASETRWQFALEGAGDGVWDWNVPTSTVWFSKQWKTMFGHAEDEIGTGLNEWSDRVHPEDMPGVMAEVQLHFDGKTASYINEHRVRCKDGSYKWILDRGLVISRDVNGKPQRMVGTHSDITERKLAQTEIESLNHELLRSNAELAQFAYAASHDMIEPLRSVSSSVHLLQKRYVGQLDARANEFIEHAINGSQRMQALIKDLLEFALIGSGTGTGTGKDSTQNMATILAAACANLHTAITENAAQISHDTLPSIVGNESQLVRLLQNLIGNAIKFRGDNPALVHVGAKYANNEWVFSVADQGIGIEAQYFERIFALFRRLHTHTEYTGTGVGLALCQKIVQLHHGRIWVESLPGQGSTFFFSLPDFSSINRS